MANICYEGVKDLIELHSSRAGNLSLLLPQTEHMNTITGVCLIKLVSMCLIVGK